LQLDGLSQVIVLKEKRLQAFVEVVPRGQGGYTAFSSTVIL